MLIFTQPDHGLTLQYLIHLIYYNTIVKNSNSFNLVGGIWTHNLLIQSGYQAKSNVRSLVKIQANTCKSASSSFHIKVHFLTFRSVFLNRSAAAHKGAFDFVRGATSIHFHISFSPIFVTKGAAKYWCSWPRVPRGKKGWEPLF